jgi:hypothetical protein
LWGKFWGKFRGKFSPQKCWEKLEFSAEKVSKNRFSKKVHGIFLGKSLSAEKMYEKSAPDRVSSVNRIYRIVPSSAGAAIPANLRNPCGCFYAANGAHAFCSSHQPMLPSRCTFYTTQFRPKSFRINFQLGKMWENSAKNCIRKF